MDYEIRPAEAGDVADLARLQVIGSHGIISTIYDGLIPGQSVAEMIERRFYFQNSTKSYRHCWVAVAEGRVLGDLHAHAYDAMDGDPADPTVPEERYAVGEPFDHIDAAARGSYHINILAVYPDFQGHGIGTALLKFAMRDAKEKGFKEISLACLEGNGRAIQFYERAGFREAARHPMVAHPLIENSGDLLMLVAAT